VRVPTLLISGRYDEATPEVVQPFMDKITGAQWVIFESSSHMPHVEERALCMQTVGEFLAKTC
jgi:L-proline amide hydrolase